jgi:hypothetical protein
MSNIIRAIALSLIVAGLTLIIAVSVFSEYPPAAFPGGLFSWGMCVAYAPGYDESGPFRRRQRERFAYACAVGSILLCIGLAVWFVITHPDHAGD